MMDYSEESIQRLSGIDHIRLRPGMYIGGRDIDALNNILYALLDLAVEQAVDGHCKHITVILRDGGAASIADDGLGMPVDLYEDSGFTIMELLINRIKGTRDRHTGKFGSMFGGRLSVVNALSEHFVAEVKRDGYLWRQEYRQGKKITEVTQVRALAADERTGTTITFTPDFSILEANEFDYETLANRLRELAFLVAGLSLKLRDERPEA